MEIAKHYVPSSTEDKWYQHWTDQDFFHSTPDDREPYTIVIPPPNVTGVLHMGHMLNNTIQDVLVRRARLLGKNACWVPGTDHASIATEAKVVNKLKEQGIDKNDLSREEFLKYAWEWKEEYGGIILEQLKKLGASCDWERTRFTMEESLSDSVISVFIDLYKKGLIYRGYRMINWDPKALTALSDEEVIHKEVQSKLYYVKYAVEGSDEWLTIATTRPETILGDTAVCVHPDDERYKHLAGSRVIIPIVNRSVPIIFDDYIDIEFGTGCLKVTPAHDINDYELGIKHKLEIIDTLNDDGTLSEAAGHYIGEDRFDVRVKIAEDLDKLGDLVKVEEYQNKVGYSERTNVVIEPKFSMQWFLKMEDITKPALEHVMNDDIAFHPAKFKNTYRHWMENIKDWCISRQLWWGQQIPAWYNDKDEIIVAKTREEAEQQFKVEFPDTDLSKIRQDDDVLDTWFSSWLWPITVFDGIKDPENADINYYYPTNDLVTAPDIIFFWVARMIMSGYEYKNDLPFKNVYFTGMVRDAEGRKMSKQLGNSPDPLDLIEKYGADGVRVGMLLSSPAGNDILFDESSCEQGRNFANKIWNAFRLTMSWEGSDIEVRDYEQAAMDWFENKLISTTIEINSNFDQFRVSDALMSTYKLIWDDFCSWYLEAIKPAFGEQISVKCLDETKTFLEQLMQLLHPFMPFISEEIWHSMKQRDAADCIMVSNWPEAKKPDAEILTAFKSASEIITQIRSIRKDKNIPNKEALKMTVIEQGPSHKSVDSVIRKLANLESLEYSSDKLSGAISFMVGTSEYFIPLDGKLDIGAETDKIKKELDYTRGFLQSVDKKLSNERFVSGAPADLIEKERQKKADAEAKIKTLEESLAQLN